MTEGDKWRLYVPYDLAYGPEGDPPEIPAYSTLLFDVELLKVKGQGKPAEAAKTAIKQRVGKAYEEL